MFTNIIIIYSSPLRILIS